MGLQSVDWGGEGLGVGKVRVKWNARVGVVGSQHLNWKWLFQGFPLVGFVISFYIYIYTYTHSLYLLSISSLSLSLSLSLYICCEVNYYLVQVWPFWKLLSGPSLFFSKTQIAKKHYKNRGFSPFFLEKNARKNFGSYYLVQVDCVF